MNRNEHLEKIESDWQSALPFFRDRGHVVFVSPGLRFWDHHGFVQQSLAQVLTENGVRVTWLDGAGWRPYKPHYPKSSLLEVSQLFELPLRRLPVVDQWNDDIVSNHLNDLIKSAGNPIVWIWGGMRDSIASRLDHIDVFSVFDDPYAISPKAALCDRSRLITCQNPVAKGVFQVIHQTKTRLLLPPVDLRGSAFNETSDFALPKGFPEKVMGYIGSLPHGGFDFDLFEDFVKSFPAFGFLLVGPGDKLGMKRIHDLKKYSHFHYVPWVERSQIPSVWKALNLSLLFYQAAGTNDGAFPVKALEGLHFGVPGIATKVPKTSGIEGYVPRSSSTDELKSLALKALGSSGETMKNAYRYFSYEMHPKVHLARVADWLSTHKG